jgi:hypothetical protein
MNAAHIISRSSSIDNRRVERTTHAGQNSQRPKPLDRAALFARHYLRLSHQPSTAENAAAASFDRTTAHPLRSAAARERCGSSGLRSAHLDRVRVAQLVLVPTSAQAPLSRPARYADVDEQVLAGWGDGRIEVGITRAAPIVLLVSATGDEPSPAGDTHVAGCWPGREQIPQINAPSLTPT